MNIENLWAEYRTQVKSFLHSKVADPADVDDILQEVVIKTFHSLNTVTEHKKIQSWLFQVTNNAIIDFYRQKAKRVALSKEDLWYEQLDDNSVYKDLSVCLLPFIQQLPEEDARLLTAIEIDKQSQKSYAQEYSINYSTLKSRLKQSRAKLYHLFNNCCSFSLDSQGNLLDYQSKNLSCHNKC